MQSHLCTCGGLLVAHSQRDTCIHKNQRCWHNGRRKAKDSGSTRWCLESRREEWRFNELLFYATVKVLPLQVTVALWTTDLHKSSWVQVQSPPGMNTQSPPPRWCRFHFHMDFLWSTHRYLERAVSKEWHRQSIIHDHNTQFLVFNSKKEHIQKCILWAAELNRRNHLTNTVDTSVVQIVSKGAFTSEWTICVDADAILADSRIIQTLVHIYRRQARFDLFLHIYIKSTSPSIFYNQGVTLFQNSPWRVSPGPSTVPWP